MRAKPPFHGSIRFAEIDAVVGGNQRSLAIRRKLEVQRINVANLVLKPRLSISIENKTIAGVAERAKADVFSVAGNGDALNGNAIHVGERRSGIEAAIQITRDEFHIGEFGLIRGLSGNLSKLRDGGT